MILSHLRRVCMRFPLAVLLLICFAYFVLDTLNGLVLQNFEWSQHLLWAFLVGATLALAGALFREGHQRTGAGWIFAWLLPPFVVGLVAMLPPLLVHREVLFLASVLWLAVAAHIGRRGQEAAFAWFNRVAIWEGLFALLLAGTLSAGLFAIEAALSGLFGFFRDHELVKTWVPLSLTLIGPLFWLGRLPVLSAFESGHSERDFLARSLQLVGTWVVTPFLFIYAAILLAYMAQMLLLWRLPSNMIGWMVLCFLFAGAVNWLLLAGSIEWRHLRLFRQIWFWLTLPPLFLLVYAAFVRVDTYGITPNRVVLMAGTIWAAALAIFYLVGRGDLRLIPLLSAIVLAVIAIGPVNLNLVSARNQAARLHEIFEAAGVDGLKSKRLLTPRENRVASAAMTQLFFMPSAKPILVETLADFDITLTPDLYPYNIIQALGYEGSQDALGADEDEVTTTYFHAWLEQFEPLDVGSTSVFLGAFDLPKSELRPVGTIGIGYEGGNLLIADKYAPVASASAKSLEDWLGAEEGSTLSGRSIAFSHGGTDYLIVPTDVSAERKEQGDASRYEITRFAMMLFRSRNAAETRAFKDAGQPPEIAP